MQNVQGTHKCHHFADEKLRHPGGDQVRGGPWASIRQQRLHLEEIERRDRRLGGVASAGIDCRCSVRSTVPVATVAFARGNHVCTCRLKAFLHVSLLVSARSNGLTKPSPFLTATQASPALELPLNRTVYCVLVAQTTGANLRYHRYMAYLRPCNDHANALGSCKCLPQGPKEVFRERSTRGAYYLTLSNLDLYLGKLFHAVAAVGTNVPGPVVL